MARQFTPEEEMLAEEYRQMLLGDLGPMKPQQVTAEYPESWGPPLEPIPVVQGEQPLRARQQATPRPPKQKKEDSAFQRLKQKAGTSFESVVQEALRKAAVFSPSVVLESDTKKRLIGGYGKNEDLAKQVFTPEELKQATQEGQIFHGIDSAQIDPKLLEQIRLYLNQSKGQGK